MKIKQLFRILLKAYKKKNVKTVLTALLFIVLSKSVYAEPGDLVSTDALSFGQTSEIVRILVTLTILTVVPALIMTVTSFTRIIIVLSFVRSAMGTQQSPPNQVLIGIALILSFFIMSPVISEIKDKAYDPYMTGEMETVEALEIASVPLRKFLFDQASTEPENLNFFLNMYGVTDKPAGLDEIPMAVLITSFITSELKKAMIMGFMIYIPFIVIDMIVSSILMAMGMMMLPPAMISLPFKILLFVMIDGWTLLIKTLIAGFV